MVCQCGPCVAHQKTISPDWHRVSDLLLLSTVPRLLAYLLAILLTVPSYNKKIHTHTHPWAGLCYLKQACIQNQIFSFASSVMHFKLTIVFLTHWINDNRRGCSNEQLSQILTNQQTQSLVSNNSAFILLSVSLTIPLLTMWKATCGDAIPNMT